MGEELQDYLFLNQDLPDNEFICSSRLESPADPDCAPVLADR